MVVNHCGNNYAMTAYCTSVARFSSHRMDQGAHNEDDHASLS